MRQQTDCDGMTCPTGSQSSSSNVRPSHAERWNRVCHGVDRRFLAQVTAAVPLCCHDPALPCEMRRWLNRLPDPGLSRVWQLYTPARTAQIRAAIVPPPCPPALGLQKNFVQSAYLQAVGKAKTHPIILNLINNQTCRFDVIEPIRAVSTSAKALPASPPTSARPMRPCTTRQLIPAVFVAAAWVCTYAAV